jgi:lauroyl/myristoyl acyltransferase
MSLSKHLQSREILVAIASKTPDACREFILAKGWEWFSRHETERERIVKNLAAFSFTPSDALVEKIQEHIILHYYEKVLAFCGTPQTYSEFLKERVAGSEAVGKVKEALASGAGVVLAIAHFGGVELLAPVLSAHAVPLNIVLRFTTELFSQAVHAHARRFLESGCFAGNSFIEIGKPGTRAALEMAAVLRRKEALVSVFDEETEYSKPVSLFGRRVLGGAGLDRLLRFTGGNVRIFNAFVIRTGINRYSLRVMEIDAGSPDPVQDMYNNLHQVVINTLEQWYFLHEEIPFAPAI